MTDDCVVVVYLGRAAVGIYLECCPAEWLLYETKDTSSGGQWYLCACSDCYSRKMSVSYVLLTMCVIILGTARHGPSGEAGVGLTDQERGGSWLVHELKHAETSPILVINEHG